VFCSQNKPPYFITAVIYSRKMFVKSSTGPQAPPASQKESASTPTFS
jgi:hypothetical protein